MCFLLSVVQIVNGWSRCVTNEVPFVYTLGNADVSIKVKFENGINWKKNLFQTFFYLETVILITNELQLRNPVLQTILYYYTDCIRQYKFRRFKNLKTSVRLKTVFLGWGGGGGGEGRTSSLSLSFRLEVPPIFFGPRDNARLWSSFLTWLLPVLYLVLCQKLEICLISLS